MALLGENASLKKITWPSGTRDMGAQKSCTGLRYFHTPPHACELFTLEQVFGSLWFATCPCARGTTGRSVSPRRSLELNNEGDYPFIQPHCRGLCGASRLRFNHSIDAPLNFLRSDAQSSKHLDAEGLVAPLVQTFQPTHYEDNSSGR